MLNGLDPIIIFNFSKLSPDEAAKLEKIPVINKVVEKIGLPPIPIYLSERLTGLYIDSEDKNIDIENTTESLADGSDPIVTQKAIDSTVKINMVASRNSIGLTLLSAVMDLIVPKVTSREYSITYLNGSVTIFGGLLKQFNIMQSSNNDLFQITLELSQVLGAKAIKAPDPGVTVPRLEGGINLTDGV